MIFVEWVEVQKFLIGGLLLCGAVGLVLFGRRKIRYRWMSVPVSLLGLFFLLWGGIIVSSNDVTNPVYSPDGRFAARVSIGPFGEQAIELFSMHGFRKEVVYWGDSSDIHWTSNSTLVVEHEEPGDYQGNKSCVGADEVVVQCVAKPRTMSLP